MHVNRIIIGRHVGYTPEDLYDEQAHGGLGCAESGTGTGTKALPLPDDAIPIVVKLPSALCADFDQQPEFMGLRHVGFTPVGDPVLSYGFTCCDAVPRDDEEEPYVEVECHGGGGITRKAYAYFTNIQNCVSAVGKKAELKYDEDEQAWTGSVVLRNGTLNLSFTCVGSGSYKLAWWGCEPECDDPLVVTGTGSQNCSFTTAKECDTPLIVNFGNITLDDCCDCPQEHTTVAAEVNVYVVANCPRVVLARHVGYEAGPDSLGIPLVARDKDCDYHAHDSNGCGDVFCGFVMTVTGEGDCDCMDCVTTIPFTGAVWEVACGGCPSEAQYTMFCTTNCDGTTTYTMQVVCGATNTGQSSVTIPNEDVEDLDITFNISLTDPAAGECTGSCTFMFTMAGWTLHSHTCSIGCDECGETPVGPPADPVEGQLHSEPCQGSGVAPPCCIGNIQVRVMR